MIQPNYTEKALVPYTPSKISLVSSYINLFFDSRRSYYLIFLCLFLISSALARCISVYNDDISALFFKDLCVISGNASGSCFNQYVLVHGFNAIFAFLAAFTVFSFPVALFSSFHTFYVTAFMLFTVINRVEKCTLEVFLLLLIFSAFSVITTMFYSEAVLIRASRKLVSKVAFCLFFALYIFSIFIEFNYLFSYIN